MDGCVYRTKDGECDLYSEGGKFHAFCCNMNTCEGRKMTNYDRIVSMTPEELSDFLCNIASLEDCTSKCPGWAFCRTGHTGMLDWLKQEADE